MPSQMIFEATPSFASIDVSFISLDLILPALHRILAEMDKSWPWSNLSFEAGTRTDRENGIIKDPKIHLAVLEKVAAFAGTHGFAVMGVDLFPYPRRPWQHRILMYLEKRRETKPTTEQLEAVVERAQRNLNMKSKNIRLEKIRRFISRS